MMDLSGFSSYLTNRGLSEQTRKSYLRVIAKSGNDPIAYLRRLVRSRAPCGTMQPAKAAVGHYLTFIGDQDRLEEIPVWAGRAAPEVVSLTDAQLTVFLDVVAEQPEPQRTILLLLPRTGLRIGELCGLRLGDIQQKGDLIWLAFRGKGDKHRVVPLGAQGRTVLTDYLKQREGTDPDEALFSTRVWGRGRLKEDRGMCVIAGKALTSIIRRACRLIRTAHPTLPSDLSPHMLRHTYATRSLAAGMDLARLKALLGHTEISVTQRYLHPTLEDLNSVVTGIEGL
jgi:site-specific recombinase XerD